MKATERGYGSRVKNLWILLAMITSIGIGVALFRERSDKQLTRWSSQPKNVFLLASLLEERKLYYEFDGVSGDILVDRESLALCLKDPRAGKFWRPATEQVSTVEEAERIRLESKALGTLDQVLKEKTPIMVFLSLDLERLHQVDPKLAQQEGSNPQLPTIIEDSMCYGRPSRKYPAYSVRSLDGLIIMAPDKAPEKLQLAVLGFVKNSIGIDESRGDQQTLVVVPPTARIKNVYEWFREKEQSL